VSSPSSSRPATPSGTSSSSYGSQRPTERLQSPSHVSPAEAAGVIAVLKDKRYTSSLNSVTPLLQVYVLKLKVSSDYEI